MKNIFKILCVVPIFMLSSCDDVAEEEQASAPAAAEQPTKAQQESKRAEKCNGDIHIIFQIGNVKYRIDQNHRTTFTWRDMEGKEHRSSEGRAKLKSCKNVDLGKVGYVTTAGDGGISIIDGSEPIKTNYVRYKNIIDKAREEKTIKKISNNIEKVVMQFDELYILPMDKSLTGNNEPIVIFCQGNDNTHRSQTATCGMNFMHHDGNYIGEGINREKFPEDMLLDAYYRTLKYYDNYKIKQVGE